MSAITPLSVIPVRTMPQDTFDSAMATHMTELQTMIAQMNALGANLGVISSGSATSIPYRFSTVTTDTDPGSGVIQLNNATQASSTSLFIDLIGSDTVTYTNLIDTFDDSTSSIVGAVTLVNQADATKWISFSLTAVTAVSGYRKLVVTNTASSGANPFVNNDSLLLKFSRTGDKGTTGSLTRRLVSTTTSSTPALDLNSTDIYALTALASSATVAAPTGTPATGASIMFRFKDNGTARALAWNTIFRASTDLPLPSTTTVSKTLYTVFFWNEIDSKWDLMSVLNNI